MFNVSSLLYPDRLSVSSKHVLTLSVRRRSIFLHSRPDRVRDQSGNQGRNL